MKNNIMIDIETLGRSNTSVIVQIAAVQFDPMTGEIGADFCCNVDAADCQRLGLTIDAETVLFWLNQTEEAKNAVFGNNEWGEKLTLWEALDCLNDFAKNIEAENLEKSIVWANSPSFDLEILKNGYSKMIGLKPFWEYRNERDFRTISKLFPDIVKSHEREGIAHEALSDCLNQISILVKCFNQILTPSV